MSIRILHGVLNYLYEVLFRKNAAIPFKTCYNKKCGSAFCTPAFLFGFYMLSGTWILNMVSTLKMICLTATHRASRACCSSGYTSRQRQVL